MLRPSPRCLPIVFGSGFALILLAMSFVLPAAAQTNPPTAPPTRQGPPASTAASACTRGPAGGWPGLEPTAGERVGCGCPKFPL